MSEAADVGKLARMPSKETEQKIDAKKLDPLGYNAVVRDAELLSISLLSLKFDFDMRLHVVPEDKKVFRYEVGNDHLHYDIEKGVAIGEFDWNVFVKVGKKKMFNVRAKYGVVYTDIEETEPEVVEFFLSRVGRVATYPYLRSKISELSWAANFDIPLMPTLSVGSFSDGATLQSVKRKAKK